MSVTEWRIWGWVLASVFSMIFLVIVIYTVRFLGGDTGWWVIPLFLVGTGVAAALMDASLPRRPR